MNHGKFPFSSVVVVVLLGCLAGVVVVLRLLSYKIHSNTDFCKFGLYSCVGSSHRFQSSLALTAISFFFLRLALTRQVPEQYWAVQRVVTNRVPHSTQGFLIFIRGGTSFLMVI